MGEESDSERVNLKDSHGIGDGHTKQPLRRPLSPSPRTCCLKVFNETDAAKNVIAVDALGYDQSFGRQKDLFAGREKKSVSERLGRVPPRARLRWLFPQPCTGKSRSGQEACCTDARAMTRQLGVTRMPAMAFGPLHGWADPPRAGGDTNSD
jgi:hypothetical protein